MRKNAASKRSGFGAAFRRQIVIAAAAAIALPLSGRADFDTGERVTVYASDPKHKVPGLSLDQATYPLVFRNHSFWVFLTGHYTKYESENLLIGTKRVSLGKTGAFRLQVPISGPSTFLTFRSIGIRGDVEQERVELRDPHWKEFRAAWKGPQDDRWALTLGLGVSLNSFTSPFGSQYQETGLTPKVLFNYVLVPEKWDLGGSAFMTAIPLSSSGPTATTIRYLGLNARVGYRLPFVHDPWRASLQAGVYYTTMITSPEAIGYQNVAGPQIFPTFGRTFSNGSQALVYFKYSPVTSGFSTFQDLSSREIAVGATYTFARLPVSISVDYADLKLPTSLGVAENHSFTVGGGYSF